MRNSSVKMATNASTNARERMSNFNINAVILNKATLHSQHDVFLRPAVPAQQNYVGYQKYFTAL